jgi:hypothetical protein
VIMAYIGGIAYKLAADYTISEQAANKIASNISVILDAGQPIPQSGEIIEIRDDDVGEVYFLGVCGIPKSPKYSSPYDVKTYSITCSNANGILARRVVNVAYQGYTVSQIVQGLFDEYISKEGFTLGAISDVPIKINIYTAADYGLQYCLDELAEYVSGAWYCTNDRKFYFIAEEDFEPFPRTIDKDFLPITALEIKVKDTDLRTSQTISGGRSETAEQQEEFTYNGDDNNFTLSFSLSKKPGISINGTDVPPERIGVKGLNDTDSSYMFLFAFDSAVLSYNTLYAGTSPPPLAVGDVLQVRYVGFYPIRAVVQNAGAIAEIAAKTGTSGIIDNVKIDKTVRDLDDAVRLGNALLENYGATRTEISGWFTVLEAQKMGLQFSDFALLRRWRFNLPEYGVVGDFVLTERTLAPFIKCGGVENLKMTLKLVDRAYLRSYGQIFDELSKATSQLSIREDDVIIDVKVTTEERVLAEDTETNNDRLETEPGETAGLTEQQRVGDFTDFLPLWCTTDASGVLMCPSGISLEMISEQHFSETQRLTGEMATVSEELGTSEGAVDTEQAENVTVSEQADTTEGAVDTEPEEIAELQESSTTTEGKNDAAPEEKAERKESQTVEENTGFMVLFCTSEAQFQTDGQIASPTGLSLYAWNTQTGG